MKVWIPAILAVTVLAIIGAMMTAPRLRAMDNPQDDAKLDIRPAQDMPAEPVAATPQR